MSRDDKMMWLMASVFLACVVAAMVAAWMCRGAVLYVRGF